MSAEAPQQAGDEPEGPNPEVPESKGPEPEVAAPEAPAQRRRSTVFSRRADRVPMAPGAAERQGQVAALAWEALGDGDAARAFLNTHDEDLGGRPIDIAIADDAGLATVEAMLARRAQERRST